MCSVPGVPTPGSEVSVLITRVNLNQNCGLVELWVNMNKEIRHVYEQMRREIQLPKRNFCGSEGKSGDLCLVSIDEKWHRARIVAVRDDKYEVFLIDQAQPHSTTSAAMAWGKDENFSLPPEIESCVLANVLSTENNWSERAVNFLKSLHGKEFEGLVQHALMPGRTILLDVPIISKHLCREGVAKKIPVGEFKNLVLKCLNLPEDDAIEPMTMEQSLNACNQLENGNCYFYPELYTGTLESIRVTELIDAENVFCELVILSKSIKMLSAQMNEEYKKMSAVEDLQLQAIGMPCAAQGIDGKWRRAVIKQITSTEPTVGVFFVDEGKYEVVKVSNVRKLDPKYLRMPVVTYQCSLEGVKKDKVWTKEELDHLKSLTLNQNIVARFERHILPGHSYSVNLYTPNAACINDFFMEKKDQGMSVDTKQKFEKGRIFEGSPYEVASPSIFPTMLQQDSFTHSLPFSPMEIPLCDQLTVGASIAVKVSCIDNTNKFWCQTSQCAKKLDVLMKDLQAHYASVHPKPLVESICVARNPDDNMWYRAKIIVNEQTPDVEVRFVDYGQTKKVSLRELRPIDPTFLRLDAQAFQCSLVNLPPTDVDYANQEFHNFVGACSAQNSGLKCVIKAVESDKEGMLLNMVDLQTQSESASQVLAEKLAARPEMYNKTTHNIEVNLKEKIFISYSETVHSFHCHLERNLHLFQQVQNYLQKQDAYSVPSNVSPAPNSICIARYSDSNWYRGQVLKTSPDLKVHFVDLGQTLSVNKEDIRPYLPEAHAVKTIPVLAIPMGLFNVPEVVPQEINEWFVKKVAGINFTMSVIEKGENGKLLVELFDGTKSLNAQVREKIVYTEVEHKHLCNGTKKTPMADMEVDACQSKETQVQGSQNLPKDQKGEMELDDWILVDPEQELKNGPLIKESPEEKMETTSEQTNAMEIDDETKTQKPDKMTTAAVPKKVAYKMPIVSFNKTQELYASSITSPNFFWCQCSNTEDLDKITQLAQSEGKVAQEQFFQWKVYTGFPCLALYKSDNKWYRAQVIEKINNTVSVVFIDYGNEENVDIKDLRQISDSLLEVSPQAFLCCLDEIDELRLKFKESFCDKFYNALVDKPLKVKVLSSMGKNSEVGVPQYTVQIEDVDLHELLEKRGLKINGDALYKRPIDETKTIFYSDPNNLVNQTLKVYASSICTPGYFWCQYTDRKELDRITKIAQKSNWAEDVVDPESLVPGCPCLAVCSEDNEWCRAHVISRENDICSVVFVDYGDEDDVPVSKIKPIPSRLMEIKPQAFLCYMENFDENAETWDDALCDNFSHLILHKIVNIKILSMEQNEEVKVPQYTVQFDFDMEKFCKSYVPPRRFPQAKAQNVLKPSQETPAKAPEVDLTRRYHWPLIAINKKVNGYATYFTGPDYFWCQFDDTLELNEIVRLAQKQGETPYDSNFANSLVPGNSCLALCTGDNKWYRAQILSKSQDKFSALLIDSGYDADICLNNVRPLSSRLLETRPQAFLCCLRGFDSSKGMWDDKVYDAFKKLVNGKHLEMRPFAFVTDKETQFPHFAMKLSCWNIPVNKELRQYWKEFDKIDELSCGLAQNSISAAAHSNLSTKTGLKKPNVSLDQTEEVFATCIVNPHFFWCQFANDDDLNKLIFLTQAGGNSQQPPDILDVGDLCLALFNDEADLDADNRWYRSLVRKKDGDQLEVAFIDYGNEANVSFKDTRLMPPHLLEHPPQAFFCVLHGFDQTKGTWEEKGTDEFYDTLVEQRLKVKICSIGENQELALPQFSVQIDCEGVDVNKLMEKYWKETADPAPQSSLLGRVFGF